MLIETEESIYEVFFQNCQIEITGRCNMRCKHCRASNEANIDMPSDVVGRVLDFALTNSDKDFRLTVSGGEPFLNRNLVRIIGMAQERGVEDVIITTNGSLVTQERLKELKSIGIKNLCIQVSVDSVNADKHDAFRGSKGAFVKAVKSIQEVVSSGLTASLRATVTSQTIEEISDLVQLAKKCGAIRVGIGSVIPAGMGGVNRDLMMNPEEKRRFLERLSECKTRCPEIDVTTEDPLKFALEGSVWDYGNFDYHEPSFFGGCSAGVTGFNADCEGTITPCAVLLKPIVNVVGKTREEILSVYVNSQIVRNLIGKKFKGKCAKCDLRRLCGGCRAVAEGVSEDYLGSDVTCWKT
jgi:radical SAM protein with 4Fe4S-binding SPASM domain